MLAHFPQSAWGEEGLPNTNEGLTITRKTFANVHRVTFLIVLASGTGYVFA